MTIASSLYIVNIIAVDGLATSGARASAAMILKLSGSILVTPGKELKIIFLGQDGTAIADDNFKRIFMIVNINDIDIIENC